MKPLLAVTNQQAGYSGLQRGLQVSVHNCGLYELITLCAKGF